MPYAVLQKSLVAPPVERLARAITVLRGLAAFDAHAMARDAYGILVQGLSLEDATKFEQRLRAEGIEAEVIDQERLPSVAGGFSLRKADCLPEVFVVHDALRRPYSIEWPHVILVAAGNVQMIEFTRVEKEIVSADGGVITEVSHHHEESRRSMVLDILVDLTPSRYRVEAQRFNYQYLGTRMESNFSGNYICLVRDVLGHASRAILNRGAETLRGDPPTMFDYPSRHAFEEETVWLLWQAARNAGEK